MKTPFDKICMFILKFVDRLLDKTCVMGITYNVHVIYFQRTYILLETELQNKTFFSVNLVQ